jgi:hypothetical protein
VVSSFPEEEEEEEEAEPEGEDIVEARRRGQAMTPRKT